MEYYMTAINQIRGMLLEEILLHLLRNSGYRTIETIGTDPTLENGPAGIKVKGRGCDHQIDAIADFIVYQPFSNPQRLLVEAKCYSRKIGIGVVRNAVGVLKDISEYWHPGPKGLPTSKRYHYQYALFSATPYSNEAEKYAFAQDIYLIPLGNSAFIQPVIDAINHVSALDLNKNGRFIRMNDLRKHVREGLKYDISNNNELLNSCPSFNNKINNIIRVSARLNYALITILCGSFPVFLVPNEGVNIDLLNPSISVEIYWDSSKWYLKESVGKKRILFSFDLPLGLFKLYEKDGRLSPTQALNMKEETMSNFRAMWVREDSIKIISFQLDRDWLERIRKHLLTKENNVEH
jgi:hypothetical protein